MEWSWRSDCAHGTWFGLVWSFWWLALACVWVWGRVKEVWNSFCCSINYLPSPRFVCTAVTRVTMIQQVTTQISVFVSALIPSASDSPHQGVSCNVDMINPFVVATAAIPFDNNSPNCETKSEKPVCSRTFIELSLVTLAFYPIALPPLTPCSMPFHFISFPST